MLQIPTIEPVEFYAGDTVEWRREDLDDFPASAGWALNYYFRGPAQATIAAIASGDDFAITIAASVTKDWNEGVYWWFARVIKGTEQRAQGKGQVLVKMNFADLKQVFDGRSHVKRTLDALKATIERLAAQDLSQYSIAARTAVRQRLVELVALRDQHEAMYQSELAQEKVDRGESPGRKILARF